MNLLSSSYIVTVWSSFFLGVMQTWGIPWQPGLDSRAVSHCHCKAATVTHQGLNHFKFRPLFLLSLTTELFGRENIQPWVTAVLTLPSLQMQPLKSPSRCDAH